MGQDIKFIAQTVSTMTEHISDADIRRNVIGKANDYARLKKFPDNKETWSDEQLNNYFSMLDKLSGTMEAKIPNDFDQMTLDEKVKTLEEADVVTVSDMSNVVQDVVGKLEEKKKYRDDLKCPYCGQMVYDNRNNKKSDRSPDFVCSTNDPAICGGHTGKWRKSWWMDNTDLPEDWGISNEL